MAPVALLMAPVALLMALVVLQTTPVVLPMALVGNKSLRLEGLPV